MECEAPFCGKALGFRIRPWLTRVYPPMRASFAAEASPSPFFEDHRDLVTCQVDACMTWARLRAEELSDGYEWCRHQIEAGRTLFLPEPPQWYTDQKRFEAAVSLQQTLYSIACDLAEHPEQDDISRRKAGAIATKARRNLVEMTGQPAARLPRDPR